ncbi:MAG: alpha/beta fold hydrolase [Roseovarius sp.]
MASTQFLSTPNGRSIAYHFTPGDGPCVVFLGGLKSDMQGTKAVHLEAWAQARGQAFLRFDYSGHGESSGTFEEGCIGDWAEDTAAVLDTVTDLPLLLVGSSMGGWQSLLAVKRDARRIAGLVTIAAAPDFTEDSMWAGFTDTQKAQLQSEGQVALPSDYGEPYIITKRMIEDGRQQLVLRDPLPLPMPTRFLQGTADADVDMSVALRLLEHAEGPDMRLTLVDGVDHRFSTRACLDLITQNIQDVLDSEGMV